MRQAMLSCESSYLSWQCSQSFLIFLVLTSAEKDIQFCKTSIILRKHISLKKTWALKLPDLVGLEGSRQWFNL